MINWLIVWLTDWLVDWMIDWLIDWLIVWLIDCLIDWLFDWLFDWLSVWLIDWLFDWLFVWLIGCLIDWLHSCRTRCAKWRISLRRVLNCHFLKKYHNYNKILINLKCSVLFFCMFIRHYIAKTCSHHFVKLSINMLLNVEIIWMCNKKIGSQNNFCVKFSWMLDIHVGCIWGPIKFSWKLIF